MAKKGFEIRLKKKKKEPRVIIKKVYLKKKLKKRIMPNRSTIIFDKGEI
jgi:hypothetical protein